MSKGIFVVLEGPQGSGKTTTAEALAKALRERLPDKVSRYVFPAHHTVMGRMIRDMLAGEIRYLDNPTLMASLFLADMAICQQEINEALADGEVVICDRYYHSALVYQRRKAMELEDSNRSALWTLYLESDLREPDLLVYFDLSPELLADRVMERERKNSSRDRNDQFVTREAAIEDIGRIKRLYQNLIECAAQRQQTLCDRGLDTPAPPLIRVLQGELPLEEVLDQILDGMQECWAKKEPNDASK